MNKCLNCGNDVKNKYCNVTCQNKHQGKKRVEKIHGKYKFFVVICDICGKEFSVEERDKKFPTKEKYYCSVSCSNTRNHSEETKNKIAKTLKNKPRKGKIVSYCKECGKKMEDFPSQQRIFCSKKCAHNGYTLIIKTYQIYLK